ncbi:MAG: hypothetical protein AAF098_15905 [Pseudomonadota bacterium]
MELQPDWILSDNRRQLTHHYFRKLPRPTQKRLESKLESLNTSDDYADFLKSEGHEVWLLFLADQENNSGGRDFTPLNKDEKDELEKSLNRAFSREHGEPSESSTSAIFSRSVIARFVVAGVLLASGFLLIYRTYDRLPELTSEYLKEQSEVFEESLTSDLDEIRGVLTGEKFAALGEQVTSLNFALADLQSATAQVSDLTTSVRQLQSSGTVADEAIERAKVQIDEAIVAVRERLVAIDPSIFGAPIDPNQAKAAVTAPAPLVQELQRVSADTASAIAPQSIVDLINASLIAITQQTADWDNLIDDLRQAWGTQRVESGRQRINTDEASSLNAVLNWNGESSQDSGAKEGPDALVELRASLERVIESNSPVFIDQTSLRTLQGLQSGLSQLGQSFGSLRTATEVMNASQVSLKSSIDSLAQNESLSDISENTKLLVSPVQVATAVISNTSQSYTEVGDALRTLNKAAASIERISEMQENLAIRGSAPAVLLLFAIGGMFVTFGLTSLLRCLKEIDHRDAQTNWRSETVMYTRLSTALLSNGIDPTPILSRLQAIPRTSEGKPESPVKMPLSETLAELVKAVKQKS